MNTRGLAIMNSRGVFQGAQVVPIVGEDAAAAQAILERLTSTSAPEQQPDQETKQPLRDPILAGLLSLDIKNAERRAQRDRLVAARLELNKESEALVEQELCEGHKALVAEHAACRERGRQQEKILGDLLTELAEIQQELNKLDAAFAESRSELNAANEERGNLGRFATDEEIVKADALIEKAAQRVEKAAAAHAEAAQERNRIVLIALPPEQEKLNALVVELNRLEALLAGATPDSAERLEYGFVG